MIFDMTKRKGGGEYFVSQNTGCIYPRVLRIKLPTNGGQIPNNSQSSRWAYCDELEEVVVEEGSKVGIGLSTKGTNTFSRNNKLKRLELVDGVGDNQNFAQYCPALSEVIIGSIGNPITSIAAGTFSGSGTSATNPTITVYVTDETTIPIANAPWSLANATVIYRSSTTGEVRTV